MLPIKKMIKKVFKLKYDQLNIKLEQQHFSLIEP